MLENVPECPYCIDQQQLFPAVVEGFPALPYNLNIFTCLECEEFFLAERTKWEYKLFPIDPNHCFHMYLKSSE